MVFDANLYIKTAVFFTENTLRPHYKVQLVNYFYSEIILFGMNPAEHVG